jgi:hypothetical protein
LDTVSTLLGVFASCTPDLTVRTAANLAVLLRGAVLAAGSRTVTACLVAAWPWVARHWSVYENVGRRARLPMLAMARRLFLLILLLIPPNAVVELATDDTLARRFGLHVVGIGLHRDAVASSHAYRVLSPGHKWVTLAVVVRLPFCSRPFALPILSVLYCARKLTKRSRAKRLYRAHRTPPELALLMVRIVVRWAPGRRFRLLGDGGYATHELAGALCAASPRETLRRVSLVSRFPLKGATYAPPPPYAGRGRRPVRGAKLPTPQEVASDPATVWTRLRLRWYGGRRKKVGACSGTGLWYRGGCPPTRVRWVVVRVPGSERGDEAFFSTDVAMSPREIVESFVRRWNIETTFQETRAHLGLETLRNRTPNAVRRSVPMLLALYSLLVVWFARHVRHPETCVRRTPWYRKSHVTFSDMLAAAREDILRELISSRPGAEAPRQKTRGLPAGQATTGHTAIRRPA